MLTSELAVHMLKFIVRGHVCCPLIHDSSFIHSFIHYYYYYYYYYCYYYYNYHYYYFIWYVSL